MTKQQITIATRESPLALKQAYWVKTQLEVFHPTLQVHLLGMTTAADQQLSLSLTEIGGKGLFIKELEEALLDGRADIAVHSMKDVPVDFPAGLYLPVICERGSPWDVFVSNQFASLEAISQGAKIGTSSLRRQAQLQALRPDLVLLPLRGNVNTRLRRLDEGHFDAIILAEAGLNRLGLQDRSRELLKPEHMLPAAGQGALGIECRVNDARVHALIQPLNHAVTEACVRAERALCDRLGGNCRFPISAYAEVIENKMFLRGLVASKDGKRVLRAQGADSMQEGKKLGISVAEDLLQQGAEDILRCV